MQSVTIGVVGGGVLGRAVARGFLEYVADVRVYDVLRERSTHNYLAEVARCDIVFICLPTPANQDGTCDTRIVEDFLNTARHDDLWKDDSCYVLRSTVPVGFTKAQAAKRGFNLPLFHSPEFLTARCSITDFQIPARNIIGNPAILSDAEEDALPDWTITQQLSWKEGLREIEDLYERRFPGVPVHIMPSNASELVKLACNTFFGLKVQAFNLFREIAEKAGVYWEDVRGGILSDGRIAHAHTMTPGPDGMPGSGGTCIPKDSADLYHCATALGIDAGFIREAIERNERLRRPFDPDLVKIILP